MKLISWLVVLVFLTPVFAHAATVESILSNLVSAFVSRILPIMAMGYLGKNIFGHIQSDPNAKMETTRVVTAIACLIGIQAVWSYIQQQVR